MMSDVRRPRQGVRERGGDGRGTARRQAQLEAEWADP